MCPRFLQQLSVLALLAVSSLLGTGCIQIDVNAQLPSFETPFVFPLPPGVPINIDLDLPEIEVCEHVSRDAILDRIRALPFGPILVGLFENLIQIEEVSLVQSVIDVVEPANGTFTGLTEFGFYLNDQPLLTATDEQGIEDKRIVLSTDNPVNLIDLIEACPAAAAAVSVEAEGQVPLTPPTKWRNTITVHIKAHIGLS